MAVAETAGEPIAMRRKRARYRAWHRGIREMDLVLGSFADAEGPNMDAAELDAFEALLDELDADLLRWVTGADTLPERIDAPLFARIVRHQQQRLQS
ncbi:hypothetical protein GCM10007989_02210 [Devosia pacifica]|uniref:FAD assembly factor SdhE n=1 Tax=Devosia pacifica TaxID=1335967 RepID=A0A918RW31_9HYPH|nr:succinate dehydrogenase assembly factor 2 [Devosia pacifica]GHA11461.1 hypothetical protein GCM10007989_02210 [Devosia pacifica]